MERRTMYCCVAFIAMLSIVTFMYKPLGVAVVLQVVVYVVSLALIKLSVKVVFLDYGFFYPKFLTALHLAFTSFAGLLVMVCRKLMMGEELVVPTRTETYRAIFPISATLGLAIGLENMALVSCSAAFSEVISACSPVLSALLLVMAGIQFSPKLMAPVLAAMFGFMLTISGEMHFSMSGTLLLLLAVVCRSAKGVMQEILMTSDAKERFQPLPLMTWTCFASMWLMMLYSAITEGSAPLRDLAAAPLGSGFSLAMLFSTVVSVVLNLASLYVLQQIGVVGRQVAGQMKAILIIMGGVLFFEETFTPKEYVGFGAVMAGVYWYQSMKRDLDHQSKLMERRRLTTPF